MMMSSLTGHGSRPRVEGDREREILESTLEVLSEVGYDRLTMDAVAKRAKASKATLYRRWEAKVSLVIDALLLTKPAPETPDTGSFREDLIAAYCGPEGMIQPQALSLFSSVLTAIQRDPEFASEFRTKVIGPKVAVSFEIYERAKARGEIRGDLPIDLFAPALAGICLHRAFMLGEIPDQDLVTRIVDELIVPAATHTVA
ncbi:TetR/AcrR family transcriptional regulator [Nocardioides jiangxiensis]|uniref:TetR/AcrR family transcriptional regulator n=1 Tax=Nocardioides jiangxiensis TaxID=3064524 RepID=A0ABT9B2U7_9ACTN|nr:TetR/AcrR family transcriptional regulator [Nocardioides sp. WY-20]MDO7869095.1 TetR/AcrR family transcriptional regulator [Nocardioides sp. WY-20]